MKKKKLLLTSDDKRIISAATAIGGNTFVDRARSFALDKLRYKTEELHQYKPQPISEKFVDALSKAKWDQDAQNIDITKMKKDVKITTGKRGTVKRNIIKKLGD